MLVRNDKPGLSPPPNPMLTHCLVVVQAMCCLCLKAEADPEAFTVRGFQIAELFMTCLI